MAVGHVILQISKTCFASASIELKNLTFQILATLKGTFRVPTGASRGLVLGRVSTTFRASQKGNEILF